MQPYFLELIIRLLDDFSLYEITTIETIKVVFTL